MRALSKTLHPTFLDVSLLDESPIITMKNITAENTDGGCETILRGLDHDGNVLGQLEFAHSGSSDDYKGKLLLKTNTGSALTAALNINESQFVGIGNAVDAGTLLQLALDGNAYLTLQNLTAENSEGGAETKIIFEDHANVTLAQIEGSHSGTSDDTKGKFIISTHTGSALTTALTISDTQLATFASNILIPDAGYIGAASATTAIQVEADGDILLAGKLGVGITPAAVVHAFIAATTASTPLEVLRLECNDGGVDLDAGMGPAINFYMPHDTASFLGAAIAARKESNVDDAESTNLIFSTCPDAGSSAVRMRIGDTGLIGIGNDVDAGTLLQLALDGDAYLTLQNLTAENGEGEAETKIIFEDHGNNALAQIEGSHSGTSDDTKGKLIISTNGGSGLATALTITDTLVATFAGAIGSTNFEASNKLTACATNAGELDFTGSSKKLDVEDSAVVDQDYTSDATPTFAGLNLTEDGAVLTFKNDVDEYGDGDAETVILFNDHGDNSLAKIEGSHSGTSDDNKGKLIISTNSGGGLATALTISDALLATFAGSIASANYGATNKLTACATNAGALDFSAASKTLTVEDDATVSQDYSSDASPTFAGLALTADGAAITMKNSTDEYGEGGAETLIKFTDHADAILAQIEGSHSGTADDTKGKLIISTHTGSALETAITIIDTKAVTFAGAISATNYSASNLLTACATNAGALDFSASSKTLTVADSCTVGAVIDDLNSLGAPTADGEFIVATGAGVFAYETTTTARTSLGVGTGDSPAFAAVSLGTGELTAGSVNRATGTLLLEIGGTAELSISSSASTFGGNIVIPDTGTIGSASATTAVNISATGIIDIALHNASTIGLALAGTLVTSTAAELNLLDGVTAVQEQGDILDDLNTTGVAPGDSYMLVGTAAGAQSWETTTTLRTSIGIGTGDSPTLTGLGLTADGAALTLKNDQAENTEGGAETLVKFTDHTDAVLAQIEGSHAGTADDTKGNLIFSTHSGSSLIEVGRFDESGQLCIGTGSTLTGLGLIHAAKSNYWNSLYFDCYSITNAHAGGLNFRKSSSATIGTAAETESGDVMGTIQFNGVNSASGWVAAGTIQCKQNAAATGTNVPTTMILSTTSGTAANTNQLVLQNDGTISMGTLTTGTLLQLYGTEAYITLQNASAENTDGGAETRIIFEDHGNNALAQIQASHSGAADDEKGDLIFSVNNDGGLQEYLRIDDAGNIIVGGDIFIISDFAGVLTSSNGANFGPAAPATITVVNGIVTAVA